MYGMNIDGWKYYNHAALPEGAPHEEPNLEVVKKGLIWKMGGHPVLARWITDWDCEHKTEWWYCIKDTPYEIESIKRDYRYKIRKGLKNFNIKKVDCKKEAENIFNIQLKVWENYPDQYRPVIRSEEKEIEGIKKWSYITYGAYNEEGSLCGFLCMSDMQIFYDLTMQKALPEFEKYQINAALLARMLEDLNDDIANGKYICDGSRNILHKTQFQEYLEKYFGFRKAYCTLHIKYRFPLNMVISILYPFRRVMERYEGKKFLGKLCGLLRMEKIQRSFR